MTILTNTLRNLQNMGLSQDHLCKVNKQHSLQANVVAQYTKMQTAAAASNVDLQICSSFRSFEQQLSIWNRKWQGELPLYTLNNNIINVNELSSIEKIHAIMLWSALPGASRHHWGTDFDVYDKHKVESTNHQFELVPCEYEKQGPCANLATWLRKNATDYGFYLPYTKYVGGVAIEPWHLSYKSLAQKIEQTFSVDALYEQLEQADILGKKVVLENLRSLVKQYTFNQGPD